MAVKATREIDRFQAANADRTYETTIITEQALIDAGTMQNPNALALGGKTARTIDGYQCSMNGDELEVIDPSSPQRIILRRVQ